MVWLWGVLGLRVLTSHTPSLHVDIHTLHITSYTQQHNCYTKQTSPNFFILTSHNIIYHDIKTYRTYTTTDPPSLTYLV